MNALTQFAEAQPVTLVSAEIDLQIATAKRFPRSIEHFRKHAMSMATLDERVAAQCLYAVPRDGKTIEGPSARLAEILVSAWGNCRAASRIVEEGREFITAQGVFLDLESNAATTKETKRRIVDKNGRRYTLDMIQTTGNAACSIALRNAVLGGIPRALWWDVYGSACLAVRGDVKTLSKRRETAIEAFKPFGIVEAQIFAALNLQGRNDIGPDQLVTLAGWLNAIKDGEADPEEYFKPVPKAAAPKPAAKPEAKLDNFADGPPDVSILRAAVKALQERLALPLDEKAFKALRKEALPILGQCDEAWPEGKLELLAALEAAQDSLGDTSSVVEGTRAAENSGANGGSVARKSSKERT